MRTKIALQIHQRLIGGQWFLPLDHIRGIGRDGSCHGGRGDLLSGIFCVPQARERNDALVVPMFSKFSEKAQS
jgi:hypothetical protein